MIIDQTLLDNLTEQAKANSRVSVRTLDHSEF